ncbi:thiol-disulfide oxidoreductase DCC family protein [Thalassotalea euphylliae]|uniref:DUF393 domain-containing protein n=1 Tax=Thalassotalea euphylliae TaxID=1655234 RepID=A0A3E0U1A4_9GAMM|nr:DUF393 domain-containing protein [Thalassotalea euphylliae]REL30490.1 DUF393 domain-containing protein [Thalassotalea euphylliae]
MAELTLFFDGNCSLCVAEINALAKRNTKQLIQFEDLHQANFAVHFPDIDSQEAMKIIHGKLGSKVITGIDVNYHAWRLVGKEFWVKPLAWPLTRPLAKLGYRLFAANRHSISKLYAKLTKQETPDKQDCGCAVPTTYQQSSHTNKVSDEVPHTERNIDSERKIRQ